MKVECVGGPLCGEYVEYPDMHMLTVTREERGVPMAYWIVEDPEERIPVYVWHRANTEPAQADWFPNAY